MYRQRTCELCKCCFITSFKLVYIEREKKFCVYIAVNSIIIGKPSKFYIFRNDDYVCAEKCMVIGSY